MKDLNTEEVNLASAPEEIELQLLGIDKIWVRSRMNGEWIEKTKRDEEDAIWEAKIAEIERQKEMKKWWQFWKSRPEN